MLGKGDVGRVYLVREKKSDKLYAMKGNNVLPHPSVARNANWLSTDPQCSPSMK